MNPLLQMATLSVSRYQRDNLEQLMLHLRRLDAANGPVGFDMKRFHVNLTTIRKYELIREIRSGGGMVHLNAKACACALGHGVYAGVGRREDENYIQYAERVFGASPYHMDESMRLLYDYIFHARWAQYDNSAEAAADRLEYVLKTGRLDRAPGFTPILGKASPLFAREIVVLS